MEYKERLDEFKAFYNRRLGEKTKLEQNKYTTLFNKDKAETEVSLLSKIQLLLEDASNEARLKAISNVENIVTSALQYIFEEDVKFKIDLVQLRGKPSCEFYVETIVNGIVSRQRPQDAVAGGYIDSISTALRYAYINAFNNPTINNAIILDEPGKMVSEHASINFSKFVKELGKMFDKQTIVITHNDNIINVADKTYTVTKHEDKSIITEGGYLDNEDPF